MPCQGNWPAVAKASLASDSQFAWKLTEQGPDIRAFENQHGWHHKNVFLVMGKFRMPNIMSCCSKTIIYV